MPSYDVRCSACDYEGLVTLPIKELDQWEKEAQCPACAEHAPIFARVIKMAPSARGGEKANARSKISQRETQKSQFTSSGQKDDMRHKEEKRRDRNQIGEAVENVRKGKFEGF